MSILAVIAVMTSSASLQSATLPLPPELRESASVVSIDKAGKVSTLRNGAGKMVCIADPPGDDDFDARCYHRDFISYLYRRQQLSAEGVADKDLDARIKQELKAGTFRMTMRPTAGYRMFGPIKALTNNGTAWTGEMSRWQSIHIPMATAEDLGLTDKNKAPMPYVMSGGELWAHVMINSPPD